ncbi:N-acetylglucosamine-6-phosphate deacetylase [Paenibacillus sp. FA6]|uniref:N-acetylglucosamine-6-phosphate deacetylase n=1 Tax=Paenibacillus sp. FA6 TaxID=3413029 RepID=UPI003F658FB3
MHSTADSDGREMALYRGLHYRTGEPIEIKCVGGRIAGMEPVVTDADAEVGALPLIAPGLVDLQINGYGGIDFNREGLTPNELSSIIEMQWSLGVTSFMPTVITNEASAISRLLTSIHEAICAIGSNLPYEASVAGIHLEGPFLSRADGPRGAHALDCIVPPDLNLMEEWMKHSHERLRIVTFSPEWPNSEEFVHWCCKRNLLASIGHTSANSVQIAASVMAGAAMSTHLGNGAHPVLQRHPNYIWDQLAHDELYASVIADGIHLPDSVIKAFYRAKAGRMLLVSDTVALAGMPPNRYETTVGGAVVLTELGRLHLACDERLLAGSALPLIKGVEHLIQIGLCSWQDAWDMASLIPARAAKLGSLQGLTIGAEADFVLFHKEGHEMEVKQTVKQGQVVYTK